MRDLEQTAMERLRLASDMSQRLYKQSRKVGDRVYVPDFEAKAVSNVRVQGISITNTGRVVLHFGGYPATWAWGDRCGIDWFITHEEAEKALEARKR